VLPHPTRNDAPARREKEHERAERRRRREHGEPGELLFKGCSSRALDEQAERLHDVP
jgi:hypothetical protein